MKPKVIIHKLGANQPVFKQFLAHKTVDESLWRPKPEKWNSLEIVCHLLDEEREDLRARVKHTLETPSAVMKPIDPTRWVTERSHTTQDVSPWHAYISILKERT